MKSPLWLSTDLKFFTVALSFFVVIASWQTSYSDERAELETLTVEGQRPDWERLLSPGTVDVVYPDDFKGEQKKLPDYLKTLPGLHVEERGGEGQYTYVSMRGSTSAQVNIYIDGVPQNLGVDSTVDLSLIAMNNIARIEVYKGYTPSRFSGAAIGGVINIVTKKPAGYGASISGGIKSLHGRSLDATVTGPLLGGTLLFGVHRDQSHGDFKYHFMNRGFFPACGDNTLPCTRWRKSNQHQITDFLLKWQNENLYSKVSLNKSKRFFPNYIKASINLANVDILYGQGETRHNLQESDKYEALIGRRQTWGNLEWGAEISFMKKNSDFKQMEFFWGTENLNTIYSLPGVIWNYYHTTRYVYSIDGSYKLGRRQLLEFRFDYSTEKLVMDGNVNGGIAGGGYDTETFPVGTRPVEYKRTILHAQVSDTFILNDKGDLHLTFIVRWDQAQDKTEVKYRWYTTNFNINSNNDSIGTWGVALKKEIGESWTIRATAGSFVRYPEFFELYGDGFYVIPGNDRVDDFNLPIRETGYIWDFGIQWRGQLLRGKANLSATYFSRKTDNQIAPSYHPLRGTINYINAGRTQAFGIEAEASFLWEHFDLKMSGTWQQSKFVFAKEYGRGGWFHINEGDPMSLLPEWEFHVRGSVRILRDSLSIFAEYHFTGRMYESWYREQTESQHDYMRNPLHVTGVGLRYNSPIGLSLTAGVDDLFNQRVKSQYKFVGDPKIFGNPYQEPWMSRYPSPGRTWYLTLDYLFGGGSASDSSGSGSRDSQITANIQTNMAGFPVTSTDGQSSSRKSYFYVTAKLIYSKQEPSIGSRGWSVGEGSNEWHQDYDYNNYPDEILPNPPGCDFNQDFRDYWCLPPQYVGPQPPYPGDRRSYSRFDGGLALGVDFYGRHNVPIRVEIEASSVSTRRIKPPNADAFGDYHTIGVSRPVAGGATSKVSLTSYTALLNVYFDFHNKTRFTPFVGFGGGLTFAKAHLEYDNDFRVIYPSPGDVGPGRSYGVSYDQEDEQKLALTWHITAGISYEILSNVAIDIAYRYIDYGLHMHTKGSDIRAGDDKRLSEYPEDRALGFTFKHDGVDIDMGKAHQVILSVRFGF